MTVRPTINRQVHYVARGSADGRFPSVCRAAIVTEVDPKDHTRVGLYVINPSGQFSHPLEMGGVFQSDGIHPDEDPDAIGALCDHQVRRYPGGTWHWAERVAE